MSTPEPIPLSQTIANLLAGPKRAAALETGLALRFTPPRFAGDVATLSLSRNGVYPSAVEIGQVTSALEAAGVPRPALKIRKIPRPPQKEHRIYRISWDPEDQQQPQEEETTEAPG